MRLHPSLQPKHGSQRRLHVLFATRPPCPAGLLSPFAKATRFQLDRRLAPAGDLTRSRPFARVPKKIVFRCPETPMPFVGSLNYEQTSIHHTSRCKSVEVHGLLQGTRIFE